MTSIPLDKTEMFHSLAGPKYLAIEGKGKEDVTVNGPTSVAFYGHHCYNCPLPRKNNVSGSDLPRVVCHACSIDTDWTNLNLNAYFSADFSLPSQHAKILKSLTRMNEGTG